jgi:type I restriction enzyme S subunit
VNALPDTWKWSTIGEVADIVRGVTYSKGDALSATDKDAVPLLRATNLEVDSIDFEDMVYVPKRVVKIQQFLQLNDIFLAASSGSISVVGKSAQVVKTNGETFGAFCAVIRPKNIHPKFLAYWVQSPAIRDHWSATAKGTNINNLKPSDISETNIPIPPIEEQRKIVERLEDHLSRLDAALVDVKQAKIKAGQFRRSMLQAAFLGHFSSEAFNLGEEIQPSWRKISMGKILQPRKQKDIPSNFPALPYIGMENVIRDTGAIDSFGSSSAYRSSAPRVFKGDVLYGRLRPYLNKVVISPCESFASAEFIVLPPNEEINEKFLQLRLLSQDFVDFAGTLDTGDRPRVSWEQISQFEIYLPPIAEQIKLIEFLEDHLSRLEVTVSVANNIEKQSSGLRRSLLQAAFTGQLTKEVESV